MTSAGRMSGMRKESVHDMESLTNDGRLQDHDTVSNLSGNPGGEISSMKVQNYLDTHMNKS